MAKTSTVDDSSSPTTPDRRWVLSTRDLIAILVTVLPLGGAIWQMQSLSGKLDTLESTMKDVDDSMNAIERDVTGLLIVTKELPLLRDDVGNARERLATVEGLLKVNRGEQKGGR